ncbi:hypothetical protein NLU13_6586 [Sarocladium strictum]|uniref:Carrier domain-containing protein n=1 Tax=Sarocladium strictum TaxID=5046 RepID=A0AA39L7F6_SARSR|nr:hypothetical protein NLU13_6586 [Sarocladium strictum]
MAVISSSTDGAHVQHPIHLLEQRARNGHVRPFAVIPKSKNLSEGFTEVTYEILANAVNRACWWLEDVTGGPKPGTRFSWSGPNDLRYILLLLAAMKCRYQILLPSPRNSEEYQRAIFDAAGVKFALGTKATLARLRAPLDGLSIELVEGLTLEQLLSAEPVPAYPFDFTFDQVKQETPLILHTSGSTGPPKPIPLPLEGLTTIALTDLVPGPRERKMQALLEHNRLFCGFPPFHAAGCLTYGMYPILCDFSVVWGPSDRPLNAALAEEAIKVSGAECTLLPPSVLEDMAKTPSGLSLLSTLKFAVYGGGPLHPDIGPKIANVTRLHTLWGSTETLLVPVLIPDGEEWNYIELDPQVGYTFEHVQENLYQFNIKRVPEFVDVQPVFLMMPDIDEWSTGDLVSPHPTKPNLWSVIGRMDDLIVLSSGEKFNPAPGEAVIRTSPLVSTCILVGRARPQAILLVERNAETTKDMTTQQVKDALWPVVEEMNKIMATQGQVTPDHILVAPLGTEFPRTPKGTVRRKQTEEMFERDLDEVSALKRTGGREHTRNGHGHSNGNGHVDEDQPTDIAQAVRRAVYHVCRISDIGDDEDLFEYGLDSIQAQQISAALGKISDLWPEDSTTGTGIIYSKPTIRGLIETVAPDNGQQNGDGGNDMEALIGKYTSDLPQPLASDEPAYGMTVAITGSTGNLGCNMLNDLIRHPDVTEIICLNRAAGGKEAQDAAFSRSKLTQEPLGDTVVSHFKVDLSDNFLGLTPIQYATLQRKVDVLIHNAWQLDFLRTVKAFEKTHIAGVRRLVDLAASSHRDMRIVFISSIGTIGGTDPKVMQAVPEEILGPKVVPGGNGYSQSKYVSEKILVEAAATSKVKSAIVRVGQIAGPIGDAKGTWSTTDWFPRMMASAKIIRSLPDSLGIGNAVDWVPVNTVSQVVTDIVDATKKTEAELNVFHINNPHTIPWSELAPEVARSMGKDVRLISLKEWIAELRSAIQEKGAGVLPVEGLLPWLEGICDVGETATLAVDKTVSLSPALAAPGRVQVPWIERWMQDWVL